MATQIRSIPVARALDAPAVVARGRRAVLVDVLRLVAALQMVLGHTIDALLLPELRSGALYDRWSFARGLTSVAFMVAAGMSYHLSTLSRFESHTSDRANSRRRLRRGLVLVALGYLLHMPVGAFSPDASVALMAWRELAIADVLHCIGVSILLLECLTLAARRPIHVVLACAVLAAAFFLLAPLSDRAVAEGPFRFALAYLTHRGGSLFPLFPWAGFVLSGVVLAHLVVPRGAHTPRIATRALVCAVAASAVALFAWRAPFSLALEGTTYSAQPAVSALKLAIAVALVAAIALVTQHIGRLPRALERVAAESLAVYVSHTVVLYAAGVGLSALLGPTFGLPAALAAGLALALGASLVALGWNRAKRERTGGAGRLGVSSRACSRRAT